MKFDYTQIEGWFSVADKDFVSEIIKHLHNETIIEIGCFKGRSTAVMMPIALKNNCQYFVIDNFAGGIDPLTEASKIQRKEGAKVMATFMANMKAIGINRSDYSLYKSDSIAASVYFPDNSIDMVFIDGDHAYESIKKDIETYWQKLKIGGILSGHDFQNKDVKRAIEEFTDSKGLTIKTGGNCFAIIKNG